MTLSQQVISMARTYHGAKYQLGAESHSLIDCSGLTLQSYRAVGIELPRFSQNQGKEGYQVSRADALPGDLVFWTSPQHVAIYLGDGRIIESVPASETFAGGVREGALWGSYTFRRLFTEPIVPPVPTAPQRIIVAGADMAVFVKEGNLYEGWSKIGAGIVQVRADGDRLGALGHNGILFVKEGLSSPWIEMASGVASFALSGNRVAIVGTNGVASVKEGNLYSDWVTVAADVKQIALGGGYIGIVGNNGYVSVKAGLYDTWIGQVASAREIVLAGTRIGVLAADGNAIVKEGNPYESWFTVAGDVRSLALTQTRVGIVGNNGISSVKEGNLQSSWVTMRSGGGATIRLARDRVGVRDGNGSIWVKEGTLYTAWTGQLQGADFDLT